MDFDDLDHILSEFKIEIENVNQSLEVRGDALSHDDCVSAIDSLSCGQIVKLAKFVEVGRQNKQELEELQKQLSHIQNVANVIKQTMIACDASLTAMPLHKTVSNGHAGVVNYISGKVTANASSKSKGNIIPQIQLLNEDEFSSISSYMKGRLKLATINEFIVKFNGALVTKYRILRKPRDKLTSSELKQFNAFKILETNDTKGVYFITSDDLKDFAKLKFTNSTWSIFTILRHFHRLKEIRGPKQILRYAVISVDT